jgi:uncharacterized protein
MKRTAFEHLTDWKKRKNRKPLIIRGARQVGKTTLIHQFGKTYKQYIYLNLEKASDIKYFEIFDNVSDIISAILLNLEFEADYPNTLLFHR